MSDFLESARNGKMQDRGRLLHAIAGRPLPEPERDPKEEPVTSFDGGARRTPPPPPPSHSETLSELLSSVRLLVCFPVRQSLEDARLISLLYSAPERRRGDHDEQ